MSLYRGRRFSYGNRQWRTGMLPQFRVRLHFGQFTTWSSIGRSVLGLYRPRASALPMSMGTQRLIKRLVIWKNDGLLRL